MKWSRNYDACTVCGRNDRAHNARGLCTACYTNARWTKAAERRKERLKDPEARAKLNAYKRLLRARTAKPKKISARAAQEAELTKLRAVRDAAKDVMNLVPGTIPQFVEIKDLEEALSALEDL